jgi:hypothetical protein
MPTTNTILNEAGGNVKGQKSKQPEKNEDRGD